MDYDYDILTRTDDWVWMDILESLANSKGVPRLMYLKECWRKSLNYCYSRSSHV